MLLFLEGDILFIVNRVRTRQAKSVYLQNASSSAIKLLKEI